MLCDPVTYDVDAWKFCRSGLCVFSRRRRGLAAAQPMSEPRRAREPRLA